MGYRKFCIFSLYFLYIQNGRTNVWNVLKTWTFRTSIVTLLGMYTQLFETPTQEPPPHGIALWDQINPCHLTWTGVLNWRCQRGPSFCNRPSVSQTADSSRPARHWRHGFCAPSPALGPGILLRNKRKYGKIFLEMEIKYVLYNKPFFFICLKCFPLR